MQVKRGKGEAGDEKRHDVGTAFPQRFEKIAAKKNFFRRRQEERKGDERDPGRRVFRFRLGRKGCAPLHNRR